MEGLDAFVMVRWVNDSTTFQVDAAAAATATAATATVAARRLHRVTLATAVGQRVVRL